MHIFFTYRLNRNAVRIALGSFCIGTLLFLIHLANLDQSMDVLGISFIIAAVLVNAIVLLTLFFHTLAHLQDFEEHISTIILVLLNIPITILYLSLITNF